jgi:cytochrome b
MAEAAPEMVRAKLWDRPTRLSHWLIVAFFAASWITAELRQMEWHRWSGYAMLGVVIFRLYWGVAGGDSARFASFLKGPRATLAYAKTLPDRNSPGVPGHNPVGAWSVVAMLAILLAHCAFGLFAVDIDGLESGPLSHLVDFDTGRTFAGFHELSFRALYILAGLHVAAVAFYLVYKRQNLVGAMITGRQRFAADPGLRFASVWKFLVGVAAAAAIAWFVAKGLKL